MNSQTTVPTILFLHGFGQSGKIFEHRLKNLTKKIKKKFNNKINFSFPDAPFELDQKNENGEIERGWMKCDQPDKFYSLTTCKYIGLAESIQEVYKLGDADKSIECIFTFSQGTSMLMFTILLHLYRNDSYNFLTHFPNLKCLVLVSGFVRPYPENEEFSSFMSDIKSDSSNIKTFDIPSLQVFGSNDQYVNYEKSKEATKFFKDCQIYQHEGKHFVPSGKEDCLKFEEFLFKYISK